MVEAQEVVVTIKIAISALLRRNIDNVLFVAKGKNVSTPSDFNISTLLNSGATWATAAGKARITSFSKTSYTAIFLSLQAYGGPSATLVSIGGTSGTSPLLYSDFFAAIGSTPTSVSTETRYLHPGGWGQILFTPPGGATGVVVSYNETGVVSVGSFPAGSFPNYFVLPNQKVGTRYVVLGWSNDLAILSNIERTVSLFVAFDLNTSSVVNLISKDGGIEPLILGTSVPSIETLLSRGAAFYGNKVVTRHFNFSLGYWVFTEYELAGTVLNFVNVLGQYYPPSTLSGFLFVDSVYDPF